MGSIYVRPRASKPDIVVESVSVVTDAQNQDQVLVELRITGAAHALLENFTLRLGDSPILTSDDVPEIPGNNILAGSTRRFCFAKPHKLGSASPSTGQIRFD